MSISKSIILNSDSYKVSHFEQYPDGTEYIYSYIESRGGRYEKTVFFGLQAYLREYLAGSVVTMEDIDEAEAIWTAHGEPFNRAGWEYVVKEHGGKLPLRIKAVPEGAVIPTGNILVSVENTDPNCFWLTSYVETSILRAVWYPTTVSTQSRFIKRIINNYMLATCDTTDGLLFKLHDFGARGVSSMESAALGGMAHLVNFMGTDTMSGILAAREYYDEPLAGFSIPAAEHSTMTIRGREGEVEQMRRMIQKFGKPGALFAVVSDSYDIMAACDTWGTTLKDELLASGGMLVVRPDSGDPVKMSLEVVRRLEKNFGSEKNSKGFKVLNNVRVIYGDGINEVTIESILRTLEMNRYSAENIAFGMGGALLQIVDRDTQEFAMKAAAARINGVWGDVFKDPISDSGKTSKKGRMSLFKSVLTGEYSTIRTDQFTPDSEWVDQMVTVFENGELLNQTTLAEVRARAAL